MPLSVKEKDMDFMMMAARSGGFWNVWPVIKVIALIVMALCAIFIVIVVMSQPGNSSNAGVITGQTETFLEKNKKKTSEYIFKKLTVVSGIVFGVLCVLFAIVATIAQNG